MPRQVLKYQGNLKSNFFFFFFFFFFIIIFQKTFETFWKIPKIKNFFRSSIFLKKNIILPKMTHEGARRHPRSAAGATRGPPQALGFWRCGAPPKS